MDSRSSREKSGAASGMSAFGNVAVFEIFHGETDVPPLTNR
jgi:hypothetical protein